MKFSCNTAILSEAISNVSLAVSQKSTISTLEGILFESVNNQIKLTSYNLELGIFSFIDSKIEEPGKIVIPAKLLLDIVRRCESDFLTFSTDEHAMVYIESGVSNFTITGFAAEDFPELPILADNKKVKINAGIFKSMVSQTIFAVAVSDSKPVQTGILFEISDNSIIAVAVDGFRLALRKENINYSDHLKFVVPGRALSEILKLIKNDDKDIDISLTKNHVLLNVDDYSVISRLLPGEFIDYKSVLPNGDVTTVEVNVRLLTNSIERTSLLIFNRLKSPLKLFVKENHIAMSCSTTIGKAYDECPCVTTGNTVDLGFNSKFLLDALKYCESDVVKLLITAPHAPMRIIPLEGDNFLYLVLPMKLKAE